MKWCFFLNFEFVSDFEFRISDLFNPRGTLMTDQTRRDFLKTSAAAATTAAVALDAKTYAQIAGSNDRIGLAFLGVGGRCQQHIDVILEWRQQSNRNNIASVGVCDVWD